jgi:methylenetetrahydrofolate reductase (NADPH)
VKDYGVNFVVNMIQKLRSEGKIGGFHFCTLNLEKCVQRVLESLGWTWSPSRASANSNKLITVRLIPLYNTACSNSSFLQEVPGTPTHPLPDGESELLITPSNATTSATKSLATLLVAQSEAGRGELNNAATWDDFPNGRFGDFKSPAFGDQDLWGGSHFSV